MVSPKCIYCKLEEGVVTFCKVEHVIPQAFGHFDTETPTLDCVCDDCNSDFGRSLDIYLARETVEGIARYNKGISSSEARPQVHLNITLDEGPEIGPFVGMKVAIDGTKGILMPLLAQFQILNQQTGETETYFKEQINGLKLPEDLYGRPGDGSDQGTWKCNVFAGSKKDYDEIVEALQANGIAFIPGEPFEWPGLGDEEGGGTARGTAITVVHQGRDLAHPQTCARQNPFELHCQIFRRGGSAPAALGFSARVRPRRNRQD
jgi:hypothetical protein